MTKYGVITLPAFAGEGDGVWHFFGTRHRPGDAGVLGKAGASVRCVVSVRQVHGTDALVVTRPLRPRELSGGGWDALITSRSGILLTVTTADCVPILIHDPVRHVVAAVHAGWRGAVAGIVPATLAKMHREFGSEPAALHVGVGPSVGPCCYEVDEPVLNPLRAGLPDWRSVVRGTERGKAALDLRALVRRQAESAGVAEERIRTVSVCTGCHPDLFYSYRREGRVNGSMVSGIMLTGRSPKR